MFVRREIKALDNICFTAPLSAHYRNTYLSMLAHAIAMAHEYRCCLGDVYGSYDRHRMWILVKLHAQLGGFRHR